METRICLIKVEDIKKYLEMYHEVVAAFTEYHNKHLKLMRSCTKGSIMEVTHALTKLSKSAKLNGIDLYFR